MAQGDYGTSTNPLESIHGEQIVYEPLTADPPSSEREEGSRWFRADLDSGNKIGTLRIQNDDAGTDIDDQPVFAEASTVDGVTKAKPIATANGEGFAPYVQEGGAINQLRFQHNGTWYGAHDSLSAIPNTGLDHLWWGPSISDISTYPDEEGTLDMSAIGGPQLSDINTRRAADYGGTDDSHTVGQAVSVGANDEWTAVAVVEINNNGGNNIVFSTGSDSQSFGGYGIAVRFDTNNYSISHTSSDSVAGGTPDTNPHVLVATYDGSTAIMDVDGNEVINAALSSPLAFQPKTAIGERGDGAGWVGGKVGAVGSEATAADAARRDELTNLFGDEFNITVST